MQRDSLSITMDSINTPPQPTAEPTLHPLFDHPDSDITLGSSDGVLFRVHTYMLKTTSGWFRTMLTLPQSSSSNTPRPSSSRAGSVEPHSHHPHPPTRDTIYLTEHSSVLEALLRITCGLPPTLPTTYEGLDNVLYASEKYDTPGPSALLRAWLSMSLTLPTKSLVASDGDGDKQPALPCLPTPLHTYALACRFGWIEEAKSASTQTLTLNILSPTSRQLMTELGTWASFIHHYAVC